jgi:hypothetical protein
MDAFRRSLAVIFDPQNWTVYEILRIYSGDRDNCIRLYQLIEVATWIGGVSEPISDREKRSCPRCSHVYGEKTDPEDEAAEVPVRNPRCNHLTGSTCIVTTPGYRCGCGVPYLVEFRRPPSLVLLGARSKRYRTQIDLAHWWMHKSAHCSYVNVVKWDCIDPDSESEVLQRYARVRRVFLIIFNLVPLTYLTAVWTVTAIHLLQNQPAWVSHAGTAVIWEIMCLMGTRIRYTTPKTYAFVLAISAFYGSRTTVTMLWAVQCFYLIVEYLFFFYFLTPFLFQMGMSGILSAEARDIR